MKDWDRKQCVGCGRGLGWLKFTKRHHCRQCGEVFCWECTQHTKHLAELGYAGPERVCRACFPVQCAAAPTIPLPAILVNAPAGAPLQPPPAAHVPAPAYALYPPPPPVSTQPPAEGYGAQQPQWQGPAAPVPPSGGYGAPAEYTRLPPENPNWIPVTR